MTSKSNRGGVERYQLTDTTGKVFLEGKGDRKNMRINISGLSGGIYVLNVGNTETKFIEIFKFIKL